MSWASDGQVYTANTGRTITVDTDGHTRGVGYIDSYRASDLSYTQGITAFFGNYGGSIRDVSSTGYPGHIVVAAVGEDWIRDPAHPNTVYGWGPETYSPHLRLYRENLTLLADIDLGKLPGSTFTDYYYRSYDMQVVFSADGNRLAIGNKGAGGLLPTLLFDTSQRESGVVTFLKALPGINPVFPTVDIPYTDYGLANLTDYLYTASASNYDARLYAYNRDGNTDSTLYYDASNLGLANMGIGHSLGFTGYKGAGPFFINGTKLSNGSSKGNYFDSSLTFSPFPAGANPNGYRFDRYDDMVTRLIRWNGVVAPNERLFLSGNVSQQGEAKTGYGFVQVYDMDYPTVITQKLSEMQVQTDPSLMTTLQGFTPSFDNNNLLLKYTGYTYTTGSTYGNYLQVKGIHNEVVTPPELVGRIDATAISPDGSTLAVLHGYSSVLDLYHTGDAGKVGSIRLPSDVKLPLNHVQFSKDNQYVAVFHSDPSSGIGNTGGASVLIYRTFDGTLINRLDLTGFGITVLSPDFSLVAAGVAYDNASGNGQGVSLFRVSSGALIARYPTNRFPVAFAPDSSTFVSALLTTSNGQAPAKAELRNSQTGQSRWVIDAYPAPTGLLFSPDGATIAQYDSTQINLLRVSDGTVKQSITTSVVSGYYGVDTTASYGFLPNGTLFTLTPDNAILLWDTPTGTRLRNYRPEGIVAPKNGISQLAVSPNGQYFAYVTDSCLVNVAQAPYYAQDVRIGAGGLAVATRNGTTVTVTVSLRNAGTDPADQLNVAAATLGPTNSATTSALPIVRPTLAGRDTGTIRVTFPQSALNGAKGSATLHLSGTYIGGTFNINQRVALP